MSQASVSAGSTKRARHLLPATKERRGFGEGVQQAQESGSENGTRVAAMPQIKPLKTNTLMLTSS